MTVPTALSHPPFGAADLSNCERELIHLAGSIQPHGVLMVLRESDLTIVQVTANVPALLGVSLEDALDGRIAILGGDLEVQLRRLTGTDCSAIRHRFSAAQDVITG